MPPPVDDSGGALGFSFGRFVVLVDDEPEGWPLVKLSLFSVTFVSTSGIGLLLSTVKSIFVLVSVVVVSPAAFDCVILTI